ncbi:MAG: exonuclease SbcCD subunit D [Treponema sp.]|jgi:exonuclease SbcD|nr:exonuclease SbcCD subunit D [Treponema sp.]
MRFLQTGDWHLGKVFYELPLLKDQQHFLNQITDELQTAAGKDEPYDALLVPGDIFDRSVPAAEAVTLFSDFLSETRRNFPQLQLFFLSGNHDSAQRLSFAAPLLAREHIHICTDCNHITEPVILENTNQAVAVYQLPFLVPGSIKKQERDAGQQDLFEVPLRKQQDLAAEAVRQILAAHRTRTPALPAVLCAHLFTIGAISSDSEQGSLGTLDQVSADVFTPFAYTALGHLHKVQQCGTSGTVWYSGSPLAYSFDDIPEKFMLSVTLSSAEDKDNACSIRRIPVHPLHKVVRLKGTFEQFYSGPGLEQYRDCYVAIQCTDDTVIENPMALLRKNFPYLLSFTRETAAAVQSGDITAERRRLLTQSDSVDPGDIFDLFIKDMYGDNRTDEEPVKKEKKIFKTLADGEMKHV